MRARNSLTARVGKECINADNRGPIFFYSLNVSLSAHFPVSSGIRAPHLLCANLLRSNRAALQQRRASWLVIIHRARNALDTSLAIRYETHAHVDIRNHVIGSYAVCQIATFRGVDAAEDSGSL